MPSPADGQALIVSRMRTSQVYPERFAKRYGFWLPVPGLSADRQARQTGGPTQAELSAAYPESVRSFTLGLSPMQKGNASRSGD